jgi:hypothetical protein
MTDVGGPDPALLAVSYPVGASDLWRWVDADEDMPVERFVTAFAGLDRSASAGVRALLGAAELAALVTYSQRRALAAVRTRDVRHVTNAFDALSAISLDAVPDYRDVAMVAMLVTYAGQRTDRRLRRSVAPAIARADPQTAEMLTEYLAEPVDLTDACGYREVDSPGGRVFVEDEGETFHPTANLIAAAWSAAQAFEADRYRVDSIGVGQELYPVWLGERDDSVAAQAAARLAACATVDAVRRDAEAWRTLTVYLAEASSERDAAAIAASADQLDDPRTPQFGVAIGHLCAVLHARTPNLDDQPVEDDASLERFRPAITTILEQTDR